jgi:hypothetical protein
MRNERPLKIENQGNKFSLRPMRQGKLIEFLHRMSAEDQDCLNFSSRHAGPKNEIDCETLCGNLWQVQRLVVVANKKINERDYSARL